MKKLKKFVALILTVLAAVSFLSCGFTANAATEGMVRVVIKNDTYSKSNGAPWDGTLVDEWVKTDSSTTMMSAVLTALSNHKYAQQGASDNYITSINGLSAFDGGSMSGWTGLLNDWFINEGFDAYTTANQTLESGDEITLAYSLDYGADCGSNWGGSDTSLNSLLFSKGTLSMSFSSSVKEYTLTVPQSLNGIVVTPSAANKNYQVRTYKNNYTPDNENTEYKRSEIIEIKQDDIIIVGVGNPKWASMNSSSTESVYRIKIAVDKTKMMGDVDNNLCMNINDCTLLQKHISNIQLLPQNMNELADINNDNLVDINDVTYIQNYIGR